MSIFGIGTDIVEVERIEESIAKFGSVFLNRIFTSAEQDYCEAQKCSAIHYAARFAAKEAVAKAFGTGIGKDLSWLDMEIQRESSGAPRLVLSGAGAVFAERKNIVEVQISLSHTTRYAVANTLAVIESKKIETKR